MNGIPGNTLPSESSFEALLRCLDIQGYREIVRIGGGGLLFPPVHPEELRRGSWIYSWHISTIHPRIVLFSIFY